ncbi:MAG: hypothetical protein COA47_15055 [Robiginitomaculum sp.]|nr:MAG: hypothetical protein COA47_15055 [Robiginitomaculum sp.]
MEYTFKISTDIVNGTTFYHVDAIDRNGEWICAFVAHELDLAKLNAKSALKLLYESGAIDQDILTRGNQYVEGLS